jgi:hypothetical protein
MKAVKTPEHALQDLQEAFDAMAEELRVAFNKTQELLQSFKRVKPGTNTYDDLWAALYVALNVLETKAHSLQEILDEMSDLHGDGE